MSNRRVWLMALGIPGLLLYATLCVAQWRSSLAMQEFTRLQKAHPPDSLKKVPAEILLGKLQALTLAERLAPDNPEVSYQTALFHLVRAETESLQPTAGSAGSGNERDPRLAASLKDGLGWINRAIILNPGYAEYQFLKASILQNLTGVPGAEAEASATPAAVDSLLREADRLDPYKPLLHFRTGSFWLALGQNDEAKASFSIALKQSPVLAQRVMPLLWSMSSSMSELRTLFNHSPRICVLVAQFLSEHGFDEEAQEEFAEAAEHAKDDYQVVVALVTHYLSIGDTARVTKLILEVEAAGRISDPREKASLRYLAGQALYREARIQEAIQAYESALRLDDTQVHIHHSLALAYVKAGLYEKAIARWQFLQAHFADAPLSPTASTAMHVGLGEAFEKESRLTDALAEYLKAAALDPGNDKITEKIKELSGRI